MRLPCKVLLTVAVAALVASPALAQRGGGGGGQGRGRGAMGRGGQLTFLLDNKEFQDEVKLTKDQVDKAKKVVEEVNKKHEDDYAKFRFDPNATPEERQERQTKMQALNKEVNKETMKALEDVLKADQIQRIKEIEFQSAVRMTGPASLLDEDVEKTLKLTDDQKKKIKTIADETTKARQELFSGGRGRGGFDPEAFTKAQGITKEGMDKALAVLTPEQKKSFKEMQGDPFEMPQMGGRGANRQGGGRRGGGGGGGGGGN